MADTQRLITTEDIQRRYDLKNLETNTKIIKTLDKQLTNTFGIIKEYIKYTTSLESKEQYFYDGTPTLENLPASEWEDMGDHLNTLYYDSDAGKVYIFKYNEDDDYYYWEELNDSSLLNVMSTANSQADISQDNLRRVFYEQPTVPYNVGDIWINGSKVYRCQRNEIAESQFYQEDWIDYTQYNDDIASSNALRILGAFKETVETEYATKALLETTADTITAEVSRVETVADSKSRVFTEEPTPPYYRGDSYIKQVTDAETGITMNLIYVCQYSRETGTYHEEDFAIQPGYATLSQLKVTNDAVTSTVAKVDGQDSKIASIEQTTEEINQKIQNIANITVTETSENGTMSMTGVNESEPIEITIIPRVDDISYLYPHGTIYPSDTLFPNVRTLEFHNTYDDTYYYLDLPGDLLYYNSEVYDEFQLHYGDGTQADPAYFQIIKRVGIDNNGDKYALQNEQVVPYTYEHVELTDGDYTITLLGYSRVYMKITLMASNLYTTQFATKVELNSAITQTSEQINLEVSKKVDKTVVISSINQTAEQIKIQAGKIDIQGTITAINNDNTTTIDGNKIETGTLSASKITTGTLDASLVNVTNLNASNITTGILKSSNYVANTSGTSINMSTGVIDTKNFKVNATGNITASGATITGSITATSGTIGGCSISNGVLKLNDANINNLNASKINAGTLSVDRIPNLTADKITTGTLNGNNVNITNLNASNITTGTLTADKVKGGTLSGASISIGSSSYYLRMGANWTKHPEVSGLNVGGGGIDMNGHSIGKFGGCANSSSYSITSGTNLTLRGDNLLYLRGGNASSSIMIYTSSGYKSMNSAYLARNPSDTSKTEAITQITGKNDTYLRMDKSCVLKPNPNGGAYIWGTEDYNKILTKSGSPSTLSIKENVKKKDISNIPSILRQIDLYNYKYKEGIEGGIEDYGYIIDYLEKINGINEYFTFNDIERNGFKYKAINHEHLEKFLLGAVITLQKEIDDLEEKYGETINN